MFRHLMALGAFFGLIYSKSKRKKCINYDTCREYYLSDDAVLVPVARNNIMGLNIKDNDFIRSVSGIVIDHTADYRPTYAILRYVQQLQRPATKFELAVLLGRIDEVKREEDILRRAQDFAAVLPRTAQEQVSFFFEGMRWVYPGGQHFSYASSQQPWFKFNSYLLYLEAFELLKFDSVAGGYTLTEYAQRLLTDEVPYQIADLDMLLQLVDDYSSSPRELNDLILYQRNPELLRLAKSDRTFIQKINMRSLHNPQYDSSGKRRRSRLIAELAKILADYKCQYEDRHIFRMENGKYYCEAHHIIGFSAEDGPDIVNNLVVLGPEAHMMLHHGCRDVREDVYLQLGRNGVLHMERFREMITVYHCLTQAQIEALYSKRVITARERQELLDLL